MALPPKNPFFTACGHAASPRAAFADLARALESCPIDRPGLCFLVATDVMAADLPGFLPDLADISGSADWLGTVAIGIMEGGQRFIDCPAIAVMITDIPPSDYCLFPGFRAGGDEWHFDDWQAWLAANNPMMVWTQMDPGAEQDPVETLRALDDIASGYVAGHVGSYRFDPLHVVGSRALPLGFSGVALSENVPVLTALSTGIVPLGPLRTLVSDDNGALAVLEGRKPIDCLIDDMRGHAVSNAGALLTPETPGGRLRLQSFLDGDILAAVSHPQGDHAVTQTLSITAINPEQGGMVLSQPVVTGMKIQFIRRSDQSITEGLSARLDALKARIDRGADLPRGGFFASDLTYTLADFGDAESDIAIFRAAFGDMPMIGIYGSGVIDRAFVHRHTALATIFV